MTIYDHTYICTWLMPMGHNYIGHNYIGHTYIGHNYIGHNYLGHSYIGHNYISRNYIGHSYTCTWLMPMHLLNTCQRTCVSARVIIHVRTHVQVSVHMSVHVPRRAMLGCLHMRIRIQVCASECVCGCTQPAVGDRSSGNVPSL